MKTLFLTLTLLAISTASAFCQPRQFSGTWTKVNTTYEFEFDLILRDMGSNHVEGYFFWRVVSCDENSATSKQYYAEKIGTTAKEFVKGTCDPFSGELTLKGYKKDDPNYIIGLDLYELKLDNTGNIGGITKANGSWLGRINGTSVKSEVL